MKRFSKQIIGMIFFMPILFISCSENDIATEKKGSVTISIDEFINGNNTRTNVDPNKNYQVTWAEGDVVGIFPREGDQEGFTIPAEQIGNSKAVFDGGYWAIKQGLTYNAYYPFDRENFKSSDMKTMIPVSYNGQQQNGNECSIGTHDFTYSDWNTATNGSVNFKFHHLGAFAIFHLPIPETATYSEFSISADAAVIPTDGKYDLTATKPAFTPDESKLSKSISIKLNNFTANVNENATIFMMMPPVDLTNKELKLRLIANDGKEFRYLLKGELIQAAHKYEYTLKQEKCYTYHVATAGTLPQLIGEANKYNITALKLTGSLNGTDIKFIRDMAGRDVKGLGTNGKLTSLDIEDASIVAGSDLYDDRNATENNVIGVDMFGITKLENINLPRNCTTIKFLAFQSCHNLRTINIPESVTIIEPAFPSCVSLTNFTGKFAQDSGKILVVDSCLRAYAMGNNDTEYTVPSNVNMIGCMAFGESRLNKINLPESVTRIEFRAFERSKFLVSINIPSKITKIEPRTFCNCEALESIIIPEGVTAIEEESFGGCKSLTSIILPESLKILKNPFSGGYFFQTYLKSLTIPKNVTTLDRVFNGLNGLNELNIKANIKNNDDVRIESLEKLYLPSSIKEFCAWKEYSSIKSLYLFAETPPIISTYRSNEKAYSCTLYVPYGTLNKYKDPQLDWIYWFPNIQEMPYGTVQ